MPMIPPMQRPRKELSAFTLVELIVVIALIVVTVSLLAPAFTGNGRAHALKAGGNNVANLALLGRQNSLTKNAMTALVVISNAGTEGDFRAWALYEMVPHPDGTATSTADWTQLGRWEVLPDGIVVDFCTFPPSDTVMVPALPPLNYRGTKVTNYQYVVFLPNGSLLHTDPASVRLVQGFRQAGATLPTYTSTKAQDGTSANYYDISMVAATGRVKLDRP